MRIPRDQVKPGDHSVNLIESESGWGQKIDDTYYFPTKTDAQQYVVDFNAKNDSATVPDWYMYAEYCGVVI